MMELHSFGMGTFSPIGYFVEVEKGLDKANVIGGPVHMSAPDGSDVVIGQIDWYNPRTGFIRVKMLKRFYYKSLLEHGIELRHMIFES